jgi:chromosome segregation ATPase
MFKSIGLNIDHPETFFVQQGKITKIVNFKSTEIMEMLMESAGVAFYKETATQAKHLMKEKGEKLEITQERMKTNFGPKLKMLEKERSKIATFEALKSELDSKTEKQVKLTQYLNIKVIVNNRRLILETTKSIESLKHLKKQYKNELDSLNLKHENTIDSSELSGIQAQLARLNERRKNKEYEKNDVQHQLDELKHKIGKKQENVIKMKEKATMASGALEQAKVSAEDHKNGLERIKNKLKDLNEEKHEITLKLGNHGKSGDDPAAPIEHRIKKHENEILQLKDSIDHDKKKIQELELALKQSANSKEEFDREAKNMELETERIKKELENISALVGDS